MQNNFTPEIEYQPQNVIRSFQERKLAEMLAYIKQHSPFYKRMFDREGIRPDTVRTLEDLQFLPTTTKEDLQRHNADFYCVDRAQIADYITTSGTLSDPTTFVLTDRDLNRLAYNEAISLTCAGGRAGNVYQLMTTIDKRFMAGLAYFLGIRMMGSGIVRVGNGIPELQWDTIQRICPDTIICVPSFILKIIRYAEEHGIDYRRSSVKKAVCIGENIRKNDFSLNLLGERIKQKWDLELYSTYASTEMSTTFCECQAGQGGHHHPELIICELLDQHNRPVKETETGELTVTTLGVEGMPLLRFKTGDIASFHHETCSCGRTTMRISPIVGRKNQMIKLKGTTLYPASVFDVLDHLPCVENYIVEAYSDETGNDQVKVIVGCFDHRQEKIKEIKDSFRAKLRVTPEIVFDSADRIRQIQTSALKRKPIKFIDKRNSV
jgi:phenylacetate-CoA ligase